MFKPNKNINFRISKT